MHNEVIISFFESDRFVGQTRAECGTVDVAGKQYHAYWPNTAYFCPVCGELWGRRVHEFKFTYRPYLCKAEWEVISYKCPKDGGGEFLSFDRFLEETYDKALLTRELLVLLQRS